MMQECHRVIGVTVDENSEPHTFVLREKTYSVTAIDDRWLYFGKWWTGESPRRYFRITARQELGRDRLGVTHVYEMYYSHGQWTLTGTGE